MTTETRHFTASAVVLDRAARRVLLVHHRATGRLMFPGGHVDDGEDPAEAALREVLEETGVAAEIVAPYAQLSLPGMQWLPSPLLTAEIPAPAKPDRGPGGPAEPAHSHIDLLFVAVADSRLHVEPALAEVATADWYSLDDLDALPVRDEVPKVAVLAWEYLTISHDL